MYKCLLFLLGFLLCCCGCQEEIGSEAVNGSLNIQLTDGAALTRTLPSALSDELQQQFQIELLRDKDGKDVQEYNGLLKDFGNQQTLRVGTYKLRASYGENKQLALDEPYYYGEIRDVLIEAHKAHSVTVMCGVANSLATFVIVNKEVFDKRMKEYYVAVSVGSTSVTWKPGDTTHPYFKTGSRVEFILKGISLESGQECTYALSPIEEVDAGRKYNYKLTMKPSASVGGIFDIVTEAHPEPITINETVPDSWLPKPKISSNDFDAVGLLTYTETADAVPAEITYSAVRPVQEVEFELNFADVNLVSLNKTYQLSSLSAEERTALENAGIQLPTWDGTSINGKLNFTAMTSGLLTQNGGQEVNNWIKVKAKAYDRWSDEATYTIKTVKPVFKVSAYPGNIWTKEFTINPLTEENVTSGNLSEFANLQYEFSTDQNEWTAFNADLRKENLVPGTSYYVRAKYRDEVSSEVTEVKTYEQIALENSGLETSSIVRGKDGTGLLGGDYGAQYEWTSWATLNELTAGYCAGTAYAYSSRSGTRPVSDVRPLTSGKAATWIITVGYGYGGNQNTPKSVTPSELFLGSYNTKGISYMSRPTGVRFWYKYAPYDNDKSDIKIEIIHGDIVIGKGILQENAEVSSYQEYTMNVVYQEEYKHLSPEKISLVFKSGFNTSVESRESGNLTTSKTANPKFRGSELLIDDISLIYDK